MYVWFNKEELKPETVQAVQHLLSIGNGSAAHEARVFVDMRRASIAPATSFADGIDLWLDELGDEFRHMTER